MHREATAPVPHLEGAGARRPGADLRTCWHAPGPRPPPHNTLSSTCPGVVNTQVQDGGCLEKNRRALPSHPSDTTQTPPLPGRGPHPARRAPLLPPLASRSDYRCKHWAAAPAREGLVEAAERQCHPRGGCPEARASATVGWEWDAVEARPSQAQAVVRLKVRLIRVSGKEISRLVGLKPRRYL